MLEDCNNTKQAKQPHKPAESFSVYQTVNTGAALWLTACISAQITHAYHNVQQTAVIHVVVPLVEGWLGMEGRDLNWGGQLVNWEYRLSNDT